jgi:hypothetical protein
MRVEAELILRDADALACVALMRTDEERRADALLLLARRVCEEICRDRPEVPAVA